MHDIMVRGAGSRYIIVIQYEVCVSEVKSICKHTLVQSAFNGCCILHLGGV